MVLANVFLPTSIKRQCYYNYFTCDTSVVEKPLLDPNCLDNRISNRTLAIAQVPAWACKVLTSVPFEKSKTAHRNRKKMIDSTHARGH